MMDRNTFIIYNLLVRSLHNLSLFMLVDSKAQSPKVLGTEGWKNEEYLGLLGVLVEEWHNNVFPLH